MGEIMEIARSFGLAGLGLLAAVLAVKLAARAVELARSQQRGRSGDAGVSVALEKLRLICPVARGTHSLDDIHDVLLQIGASMDRLHETQERIETDTKEERRYLHDVLSALRLELAKRVG